MANVNDTNNTRRKLTNAWEGLAAADIDDGDRQAIERFVNHRRDAEGASENTQINDLTNLRRASERADTPLLDMTVDDLNRLWRILTKPKDEGGHGLNPDSSGMYGYKRAARVFFQWLNARDDYGTYPFADGIELPDQDTKSVDRDALLTESQVANMVNEANNQRDRALIEFFADTCGRLSLIAQLRVGDIHDLHTHAPYFTPNDSPKAINHKGADEDRDGLLPEIRILDARAELRVYLDRSHVDAENDDAPLWPVLRGYDYENPEECAVSNDRIEDMVQECAKRAGIEKRVTPHSFRHVGVTRLKAEGEDDREIMRIAGWNSPEMLNRYDHLDHQERNREHHRKAGYLPDEDESDDADDRQRARIRCTNCTTKVLSTRRSCPQCGELVGRKHRLARERLRETTMDDMAEPEMPADAREVQRHLLDLMNDDEFIADVSDRIAAQAGDD